MSVNVKFDWSEVKKFTSREKLANAITVWEEKKEYFSSGWKIVNAHVVVCRKFDPHSVMIQYKPANIAYIPRSWIREYKFLILQHTVV